MICTVLVPFIFLISDQFQPIVCGKHFFPLEVICFSSKKQKKTLTSVVFFSDFRVCIVSKI